MEALGLLPREVPMCACPRTLPTEPSAGRKAQGNWEAVWCAEHLSFPVCSGGRVLVVGGGGTLQWAGQDGEGLESKPCQESWKRWCFFKPGGGEAGVLVEVHPGKQTGCALGHTVPGRQVGAQNRKRTFQQFSGAMGWLPC